MAAKIYSVTGVRITGLEKFPPVLFIDASGETGTTGWTNGILSPYIYVKPPADGIYEFDFIADEPHGIVPEVITPIKAKTFQWKNYPLTIKGIKVYASSNEITETV
jgi:hypothetical protein